MRGALLGALLLGSGCAEMLAQAMKDSYIQQELDKAPIAKPQSEVMAETVSVLTAEGWSISNDGGNTMRSQDKASSTCPNAGSKTWVEAVAEERGGGVELRIQQHTDCYKENGEKGLTLNQRLWTSEMAVLKRLEPERAAKIEAEGERRKQAELGGK